MDAEREIEAFRLAARGFIENPCTGTRYALEMAAAACELAGVDPSTITPDGIDATERHGRGRR